MARKKAVEMVDDGVRITVLALKGHPVYRDWLNDASNETLIPVASIVRDALAKWAKDRGLPSPPQL